MNLRVLVMKEEGTLVAQCLDYDIAAQAPTLDKLEQEFNWALISQLLVNRLHEKTPADTPPAPQSYHDRYARASTVASWKPEKGWKFRDDAANAPLAKATLADIASIESIEVRVEP